MPKRGPVAVGNIVAELLARRGLGRRQAAEDQQQAWREAVGEWADSTRPGPVRRGVLQVTVANSTLVQELTFQKQELLDKLKQHMPEATISDIRFRVGSLE